MPATTVNYMRRCCLLHGEWASDLPPSLLFPPPQVSGSPLETLQQIESLTSSLTEHLPHSSIFQLSLEALRTTSELVSPPSSNTSLPAPSSLPSFPLSLPTLPKQALYGQPTMEWSDYERLLSPVRLSFISADLLLGYLRFCSSTVTIHKGIAGKVRR